MDLINFGKKLKKLRIENGLTQQQLAARLGVSKSVISYYELQERIPSPDVLSKLASIFHVSSDYLIGIESRQSIDVTGLTEEDIAIVTALVNRLREKSRKE